jgi:uncharacterized protein YdhG (YjbR/CyaY superfamily)
VSAARSVDEYIAGTPDSLHSMLTALRDTIRQAAPEADERISYGMPYYHLNGRLAYFQAYTHHIGLYPFTSEEASAVRLDRHVAAKATLQFPLDQTLPLAAIRRLIEQRAKTNMGKAAKTKSPKR